MSTKMRLRDGTEMDPLDYNMMRAGISVDERAPCGELLSHPSGKLLADMLSDLVPRPDILPYEVGFAVSQIATSSTVEIYFDTGSGWTLIRKNGPFNDPEKFLVQEWLINYKEYRTPLVQVVKPEDRGFHSTMRFFLGSTWPETHVKFGLLEGDVVPMHSEEVDELAVMIDGFFAAKISSLNYLATLDLNENIFVMPNR